MGVLAVREPHAMHALAGDFHITDLPRFGWVLNAVDSYARLVGNAGADGLVKVGPLLILNHDMAGDLHFVGMRVVRMGHLFYDSWIGWVFSVKNGHGHGRRA